MNIYFDLEFSELSRNAQTISVGLYCKDLKQAFYAEFTDYDSSKLSTWVKDNVIKNLIMNKESKNYTEDKLMIKPMISIHKIKSDTLTIKKKLLTWLESIYNSMDIKAPLEFYSDVLYIDWMIVTEMLSTVIDGYPKLPDFINYIPQDISSVMKYVGIDPDINREEFVLEYKDKSYFFLTDISMPKHNALWDALVIAQINTIIDNEFVYNNKLESYPTIVTNESQTSYEYTISVIDANHNVIDEVLIQSDKDEFIGKLNKNFKQFLRGLGKDCVITDTTNDSSNISTPYKSRMPSYGFYPSYYGSSYYSNVSSIGQTDSDGDHDGSGVSDSDSDDGGGMSGGGSAPSFDAGTSASDLGGAVSSLESLSTNEGLSLSGTSRAFSNRKLSGNNDNDMKQIKREINGMKDVINNLNKLDENSVILFEIDNLKKDIHVIFETLSKLIK